MSGIERLTLKKGFAGGKLKKLRVARRKTVRIRCVQRADSRRD